FTLIELMVVLLILAILMAIAIPTFLGVTGGANDRAAQSNLTNGVTEMSAIYQANNQSFTSNPSALTALGNASAPEFQWTGSACTSSSPKNCISVTAVDAATTGDAQGVELADYSSTGTCWYALVLDATPSLTSGVPYAFQSPLTTAGDIDTAGTYYAQKPYASGTGCVASSTTVLGWGKSYNDPAGKN
ncbi:MAG: type II secretion system protein, partial [Actinomycetota bacterium]|nr:type II secretion system protein [Actinomycetota bacterium]